jgi:hypothetical protein
MLNFLKRWRSIMGILVGIVGCFLAISVIHPKIAWMRLLLGVAAALSIAGVTSPREGGWIGVFVPFPAGLIYSIPLISYYVQQRLDVLNLILGEIFGVILFLCAGAFVGWILGMIVEKWKKDHTILD